MATTPSITRNRKKMADMFDMSEPIVPHRYYPAEYVAELVLMHPRAVTGVAEQVKQTRKQSPSIPRPSWILAYTQEGKDKLRFRGSDILLWQDQVAGIDHTPASEAKLVRERASSVRLPKRKPMLGDGRAAA